MDLGQIIIEYRIQADDNATPPLTSDETLALWASEAERETCERGDLILDASETEDVTVFAVSADQATVTLSETTRKILSAQFTSSAGGRARNLSLTGFDRISDLNDWRTDSCSRPDFIAQLSPTQARLYPIPNTAGTLKLTLFRLPLYDMEDEGDEPEIPAQYHRDLVQWLLYKTFAGKDGEQEDLPRSRNAYDTFEARFGKRHNARVQRKHYQRYRVTTRPI